MSSVPEESIEISVPEEKQAPAWMSLYPPNFQKSEFWQWGKPGQFLKGNRGSLAKRQAEMDPLENRKGPSCSAVCGRDVTLKDSWAVSTVWPGFCGDKYEKPWLRPRATSWYWISQVDMTCANTQYTSHFSIILCRKYYLLFKPDCDHPTLKFWVIARLPAVLIK